MKLSLKLSALFVTATAPALALAASAPGGLATVGGDAIFAAIAAGGLVVTLLNDYSRRLAPLRRAPAKPLLVAAEEAFQRASEALPASKSTTRRLSALVRT